MIYSPVENGVTTLLFITIMKIKNVFTFAFIAGIIIGSLYGIDHYVKFFADPQSKVSIILLWLGIILLLGKLSGVVERLGQAAVLGELLVGLLLGNATLIGITFLEPMKVDPIIAALSRLGTVILFFQAGLVSDIRTIFKLWKESLILAVLGIVFSFGLFYFILPFLIPHLDSFVRVFLAFALSPTGTGVTARVLQDLGKMNLKETQLILSAGAVDNILMFIILAVLMAYNASGGIHHSIVSVLLIKVIALLTGIVLFCLYALPVITAFLARVYPSRSLKFALALGITLISSYLAHSVGISPIIGAFVAGLAMSPSYFHHFKPSPTILSFQEIILQNCDTISPAVDKQYRKKVKEATYRDLEDMLTAPAFLLVAVFFVVTGMGVPFSLFTNIPLLQSALIILIFTFVTKMAASAIVERKLISVTGIGMSPRGVTTLVYATAGKNFHIITPELYALIVLTVILTTLVTPIMLSQFLKRGQSSK